MKPLRIEIPKLNDMLIRQQIADFAKEERELPDLIELPIEYFFNIRDQNSFVELANGGYRLYNIPLKFY